VCVCECEIYIMCNEMPVHPQGTKPIIVKPLTQANPADPGKGEREVFPWKQKDR
jgi:hypothetical protein